MLRRRAAGKTHIGRCSCNQDNVYVSPDEPVFAVAHGVGEAPRGAKATAMVCSEIQNRTKAFSPSFKNPSEVRDWITTTLIAANRLGSQQI
jgi:serine/threonine protein phosphatase PrpC